MLGLLQIAVSNMAAYLWNKIIVNNSFIIIRRAALGKTYILSKKFIKAKQRIFTTYRIENYEIILYLKNGSKIKTGYLNCKGREEFYKSFSIAAGYDDDCSGNRF